MDSKNFRVSCSVWDGYFTGHCPFRSRVLNFRFRAPFSASSFSLTRSCQLPRPSGQSAIALSRACPGARLWLKIPVSPFSYPSCFRGFVCTSFRRLSAPEAWGISAICPYLGGTKSRQRPALKFTRFDFHSPSAPLREISIPLSTLSFVSVSSFSLIRSCPLPRPSGQSAIALSRACPGARLWLNSRSPLRVSSFPPLGCRSQNFTYPQGLVRFVF
jgi:hypothetical protein